MTNGTTSPHAMYEVETVYDDNFVMLWHDQMDLLLASAKPSTIVVFLALLRRANRKRGMSCFPSLNTIAKDANVSRKTVTVAVKELADLGLVSVQQRRTESGDATSNLYRIHRPEEITTGGVNSIPTPGINSTPRVVQNLHPNHMKVEPDEIEPEYDPPKKSTRKTAAPDAISDTARSWARKQGLDDATIEREAQQFLDHHAAKGSRYVDWDRAFYTWVRNSIDWGKAKTAPTPAPDRDLTQDELKQYSRWDTGWQAVYGGDSAGWRQWQQDFFDGTLRQRRKA